MNITVRPKKPELPPFAPKPDGPDYDIDNDPN